jgi:hypothetical protein
MGWNDARVSLLPVGAKLTIETDSKARTASGSAVKILRAVGSSIHGPSVDEVRSWLEQRGFALSATSIGYQSWQKEDVDAFIASVNDRVEEIIVTFVLNPKSYLRVGEWQGLITEFHERWGLVLIDRRTGVTADLVDFPVLLAETAAWKEFARAHTWPEVARQPATYDLELAEEMLPEVRHTWPANEAA